MTTFLQLHLLTSYPVSNLNRDDTGRPKTAVYGGAERLRISSQSLKRAWRVSDTYKGSVLPHYGTRSYLFFDGLVDALKEGGMDAAKAYDAALAALGKDKKDGGGKKKSRAVKPPEDEDEESGDGGVAAAMGGKAQKIVLGTLKSGEKDATKTEEAVFLAPEEIERIEAFAAKILKGEKVEASPEDVFVARPQAADIAMFGRMLAASPEYNVDAAVQVSHALTTHGAPVEDDYFTAVDDLQSKDETGAGFISQQEFGAGLFYVYICIDTGILLRNLTPERGVPNVKLAQAAIEGLARAAMQVSPSGKQNSYASRSVASYALAERGDVQPCSLAMSFLKPVAGIDLLSESTKRLVETRDKITRAYGWAEKKSHYSVDVMNGEGTLDGLVSFMKEGAA